MTDTRAPGAGTLAVHGGEPAEKEADSLITPVYLTSSYVFDSTRELKQYFAGELTREEYGRYGNPTVRMHPSRGPKSASSSRQAWPLSRRASWRC
jgi:cystathionine gamma-synthase